MNQLLKAEVGKSFPGGQLQKAFIVEGFNDRSHLGMLSEPGSIAQCAVASKIAATWALLNTSANAPSE